MSAPTRWYPPIAKRKGCMVLSSGCCTLARTRRVCSAVSHRVLNSPLLPLSQSSSSEDSSSAIVRGRSSLILTAVSFFVASRSTRAANRDAKFYSLVNFITNWDLYTKSVIELNRMQSLFTWKVGNNSFGAKHKLGIYFNTLRICKGIALGH